MGLENHLWSFFCIFQWVVVVVWERKWRKQWVWIFSNRSHDLPHYLNKRQNWNYCHTNLWAINSNYFLLFFHQKVHWTVHWRPSHFQCLSNGKSIGTVHWTHCLARLITGQSLENYTNFHPWKLIFSRQESSWTMWGSVKTSELGMNSEWTQNELIMNWEWTQNEVGMDSEWTQNPLRIHLECWIPLGLQAEPWGTVKYWNLLIFKIDVASKYTNCWILIRAHSPRLPVSVSVCQTVIPYFYQQDCSHVGSSEYN